MNDKVKAAAQFLTTETGGHDAAAFVARFGLTEEERDDAYDLAKEIDYTNSRTMPSNARIDAWDLLHEPYVKWLAANSLPQESAEELLYRDTLTDNQRKWLTAFVELWDATEDGNRDLRKHTPRRTLRADGVMGE